MKIIKRKNKPLIIAVLAAALAVLTALAIILTVVMQSSSAGNTENEPPEILPGEGIYANEAITYPHVAENKFLTIRVEGTSSTYALMRPSEDTVEQNVLDGNKNPVLDENGNNVTEKVNNGSFRLYYHDANDNPVLYLPDIYALDPTFDYSNMYAIEKDDQIGTIYKLTYLVTALGTTYFGERMDYTDKTDAFITDCAKYGIISDKSVTVSFLYIDENNEESSHKIVIGDKLITGSGYYFTVDNRPYIYSTDINYFSYAMAEFTTLIKPVLTAAGLPEDNAFEPYLTTDLKQYVNTTHSAEKCSAPECVKAGYCTAQISSADRVVITTQTHTPGVWAVAPDVVGDESDGYITDKEQNYLRDLKAYATDPAYRSFVNALLGRGTGSLSPRLLVTLPTYSKIVELTDDKADSYEYTIYEIEALLTNNGDITAVGTAVPENGKIRVKYSAKRDGVHESVYAMHGVIDLSNPNIPADVKAALTAVGDVEDKTFTIDYNEGNAVIRNIKKYVSEIVRIVDSENNAATTVTMGSTVLYRYYITLDGERVGEEDSTLAIKITEDLTGDDLALSKVLMGKSPESGLALEYVNDNVYNELFADFITYDIASIKYIIKSECVVSFEFQQFSGRDTFYGESVYKNTLENKNQIYGLNASVCEQVAKILGGITTTATGSEGLIGLETVAVGITADVMERYNLFDYTVYFEIPRGINAVEYDESKETVNEFLNDLDNYIYDSTLGFTLYISRENDDGTRYIGSDLYDIVAKVDGKDFVFLEYDFVEFYARRNLVLTNISNIKNVTFDFYMEDIYGKYSNELTHQGLYAYKGKVYSKETLIYNFGEEAAEAAINSGDATLYDAIRVYTTPSSNAMPSAFSSYYNQDGIINFSVGGKYYGVGLHSFYSAVATEKLNPELDTQGTSNFKEIMEIIYYTRYESVLTDEEQAAGLAGAPCLMKLTVTMGKAYPETDSVNAQARKEGLYYADGPDDYVYEFYRISDRKIMVKISKENRNTGERTNTVSDFYISTFAFKKIVSAYMGILSAENLDNDLPTGVIPPATAPKAKGN